MFDVSLVVFLHIRLVDIFGRAALLRRLDIEAAQQRGPT
jgi:hypothetical protein